MAKDVTQVIYIHGGMTFRNQKDYHHYLKTRPVKLEERVKWSGEYLSKALGKRFQVSRLRMPLADNAKYVDWKICFESYIPLMKNNIILIGMSLGGTFLAKYLSENKFPRKIKGVYLTGAPFDDSLPDEDLVGGFKLRSNISKLDNCSKNVYLLFSSSDEVVPPNQAYKFAKKLKNAKVIIMHNVQGHFKVSKFPELIKMIKRDVSKK